MAINRVEKLIINMDTTLPLICNWDTCDRRARTSHQVRLHEHTGKCNSLEAQFGRHVIMVFCSDSHLDYWVASTGTNAHLTGHYNQGRIYGYHSPGMRRSIA